MRDTNRQRVHCPACGWTGGRAAGSAPTVAPCSKCGGQVESIGPVYVEERILACCPSCSWWGERNSGRLGQNCPRCGFGVTERAYVVTGAGQVMSR